MLQCIRTYRLRHQLDESFGFSQWHYDTRNALLVEIIDDSGACGWGECYGPAEVTQSAIHSFYAPLLIGWNPLRNEAAWQHCWRASLDFARKGVMMGAMSGLDMALLDLKGKLLGVSASELMGGRVRDTVSCYATGMYFRKVPEPQLLEMILAEAAGYVKQGYGALKIKVGKNIPFDTQLIREMRRAFPETRLMADSNHAYDLPEAIAIGRVLDEQALRLVRGTALTRTPRDVPPVGGQARCADCHWRVRTDSLGFSGVACCRVECRSPNRTWLIAAAPPKR